MPQVQLRSSRSASTRPPRRVAPERRITARTVVGLCALGLTLIVFAVAVGPRLIGPMASAPRPTPAQAEADRDTTYLRGLPIERLRQEQKKRAAAVNRLLNTVDPPRDELAAARDAAYRVSTVLAELKGR